MLRHLFRKKVNLHRCQSTHEYYGAHECLHLHRLFYNAGMTRELLCGKHDRIIKHSDKIKDCPYFKEKEE